MTLCSKTKLQSGVFKWPMWCIYVFKVQKNNAFVRGIIYFLTWDKYFVIYIIYIVISCKWNSLIYFLTHALSHFFVWKWKKGSVCACFIDFTFTFRSLSKRMFSSLRSRCTTPFCKRAETHSLRFTVEVFSLHVNIKLKGLKFVFHL